MKKILIIPFILILLVSIVSADNKYNNVGGKDQDFSTGTTFGNGTIDTRGNWNAFKGSDFTETSAVISSPRQIPLVEDLNNDGINDIIVLDGNTMKIFHNRTLTAIDSFLLESAEYNTIITFDIDGDGLIEIITQTDDDISILELNATNDLGRQAILDIPVGDASNSQVFEDALIGCRAVNDCFIVGNICGATSKLHGAWFNSSIVSDTDIELISRGASAGCDCFSAIPYMEVEDYDDDGEIEYIFTTLQTKTANPQLVLRFIGMNGTVGIRPVTDLTAINVNTISLSGDTALACSDSTRHQFFTSPLVKDLDGFPNQLEIIVGSAENVNEFKIFTLESDGTVLDDYPELFQADGEIISNVMYGNIWPDTSATDFCVLGYDNTDDELDLLCASEELSEFFGLGNADEYKFTDGLPYNISLDYPFTDTWQQVAHLTQQSQNTVEGVNINEIATPYGIFGITDGFLTDSMDLLFSSPKNNSVLIPVDTEKVGLDDLLLLTDTNLWYIDDNFVNSQAQITKYTIDPCIDSVWKINTTVSISVTVDDINEDDVSAKVNLFDGNTNEQNSSWSVNTTAGTTFSFSSEFTINKTGTFVGKLFGRDIEHANADFDIIPFDFSVALNGVEQGDCITTRTIELITVPEEEEVVAVGETDTEDNAILTGLREFGDLAGLGDTVLWLLVMVFVAYGIWTQGSQIEPHLTFGVLIIVEVALVMVGTLLGFIGIGIVIIITILSLTAVAMFLRKIFTGTQT